MPPKTSEFDRAMQALEAEIKRLEAEYNMFFAGRLPRLPWETRARVEALVKRYDRSPMQNTAERFRFNTLQARFSSFCELWEKQLRAKEEGRSTFVRRGAAPPPPAHSPRPSARSRVKRESVLHEATLRDPSKDTEQVKELYRKLAEARSKTGEPVVAFDRFAEAVRAQVRKVGGGRSDVVFRVEVKDGKATLAVKSAEGE